jgi:Tfp pilus assembly protein PilX
MRHVHHRPNHSRAKPQRGLVLVIALILMAIIGISSSAAIRLALSSNAVSMGLRANNEAFQRADIALRWCELQTRMRFRGYGGNNANFNLVPKDVNTANMATDFTQFTTNARPVPATILVNAGFTGNQAPLCLSQERPANFIRPIDDNNKTGAPGSGSIYGNYVVTVRATSADFREITKGSDGGGEVWLQSSLMTIAK